MCGIWALISSSPPPDCLQYISKLAPRGPEQQACKCVGNVVLGFTRLAINGLTADGDQPMTLADKSGSQISWICNGEIYNYKDLAARHGIPITATSSDCQILGPLYERYADDLPTFFSSLDGVFALIIVDEARQRLVVGRDPYGVRPLFSADTTLGLCFASEMKAIPNGRPTAFKPGAYTVYSLDRSAPTPTVKGRYHTVPKLKVPVLADQDAAEAAVATALTVAVRKRMLTERPVAALLSGGIDSSLIAALVARELRNAGAPVLKTFSIGFAGSEDLRYARMVAAWIGSEHHEIVATADDFFAAIPEVIRAIESYDTTTVRASVGNYLVAKAVAAMSDCKVVFNGDGSDEVFGSYIYFYAAPSDEAFEAESARLLRDIHLYDVLRSDRSISSHGLEPRTPFLDKEFVASARAVSTRLRRPITGDRPEKWILRRAFADSGLLPNEVLWRKKEAFSDGVSGPAKLWYQEIQERVPGSSTDPAQAERDYYESIFHAAYPNCGNATVPYRWMPRWVAATDPSARTLKEYDGAK
jgi:asparagine synthase (glutamine-hydrolysing)